MTTTQERFAGLAFPVIRVRYTGNGYAASLRRDSERTFRASTSYDHALSASQNALRAARKCWDKCAADIGMAGDDRIFIPGDLDAERYAFTVVPADIFG
jgi:hypothetical protein